MYEPQHFLESQENSSNFGDPKSWLSMDANSFLTHRSTQSSLAHLSTATNCNLDHIFFKDLVEIVPLVQSFIDQKASNSFMQRGSVAYTKTPSVSKKVEQKGRNAAQSIPARQKMDHRDNDGGRRAEEDRSLLSRDAEVKPRGMNYGKFLHEVEKDAVGANECYCRAVLGSPGDGELLSLYAKLIWETQNKAQCSQQHQAVRRYPPTSEKKMKLSS
ncbi:hypothetical protein ACFX11_026900 [Malus domestica]